MLSIHLHNLLDYLEMLLRELMPIQPPFEVRRQLYHAYQQKMLLETSAQDNLFRSRYRMTVFASNAFGYQQTPHYFMIVCNTYRAILHPLMIMEILRR